MVYCDFSNSLYKYFDIYHNGLKKLANKEMQAIVGHLREMSDENQDEILTQFLSDYCDSDVWDTLKDRGNADIPYELKEYILMWITPRCEEKKMPECRWYYELFRNHKQGYQAAVKYLEIAYSSMKCDQKTIDLLFDSYLDILGWGAHHFPDGCIIEDNTIVDCFQKCEDILKEKTVSERLINQLNYYRILYECYNRYVDDGRKRKFEDYLNEANIHFLYSRAFYYEK